MSSRQASVLCWSQPKGGNYSKCLGIELSDGMLASIHEALGSAPIMGEEDLARINLSDLNQENAYAVKELRR